MPVYRYLDLSSAHLTQREADELSNARHAFSDLGYGPRVIAHEYGAWVNVPGLDDATDVEDHAALVATRPNLAACIDKAREYDCAWINFDRDADTDATLPTYEW